MPRLLSRSKHEDFESNSTLQIRIRRKEGAEAEKEGAEAEKEEVENFAPQSEISHHGIKIPSCATVHAAFDILTFLYPFLISSHFALDV